MTVNNNTSRLNDINSTQSNLLEKIATGLAINKASDDSSALSIANQLANQQNSISQSLQNVSSGIAMSNIAQGGISDQKEILENIKVETLKAMNSTISSADKEIIANTINQYINQYEQIANTTNYNGEQLLKTNNDASDDLSIVGDESVVSIQKADTTSISDQLKTLMIDFTTNPNSMESILNVVDEGINTLSSDESRFATASTSLESMARNYISAQTNIANAKSTIMDFDYSKGISDFNKANIQEVAGYFAQSQANAVQSRTIELLS